MLITIKERFITQDKYMQYSDIARIFFVQILFSLQLHDSFEFTAVVFVLRHSRKCCLNCTTAYLM